MRIGTIISLLLLGARAGLVSAAPPGNQITVHVDQPTVALPETLYGLFYEDINYAADGGLYAELVQNRSFEYYPLSEGWNPLKDKFHPLFGWEKVERGGGSCTLTVEDTEPLNANNTKYVRLSIRKPGTGVGLANLGFDGIHVEAGESYDFSFHARRTRDVDVPVRVSIQGSGGELGKATIEGLSTR